MSLIRNFHPDSELESEFHFLYCPNLQTRKRLLRTARAYQQHIGGGISLKAALEYVLDGIIEENWELLHDQTN